MLLFFIPFFFSCYRDHRDLHSFPTRRSSDLDERRHPAAPGEVEIAFGEIVDHQINFVNPYVRQFARPDGFVHRADKLRSEEHTSELQSRGHLVCRLLLEKKKNNNKMHIHLVSSSLDVALFHTFFFFMLPRPQRSTLFPYTTLFRS